MSDRFIHTSPPPIITQELIDSIDDPRIRAIKSMISIENELRDSPALKLVIEGAKRQADTALEDLYMVDPTDTKKIIALQAIVYRARFIAQSLNDVLARGQKAENSLRDDSYLVTDENEPKD